MIEEIEEAKTVQMRSVKANEDGFQIKDIWPQLKKAINWLLKHGFEGATELLAKLICRRKQEKKSKKKRLRNKLNYCFNKLKREAKQQRR